MIRRPPRSTLFPTRRSSDLQPLFAGGLSLRVFALPAFFPISRSEEHTSELQSRLHLVCRLLLEKQKKKCHNGVIFSGRKTHRHYNQGCFTALRLAVSCLQFV